LNNPPFSGSLKQWTALVLWQCHGSMPGAARVSTLHYPIFRAGQQKMSAVFSRQTPTKRLSVITFMTPVADTPGSIVKS
jgi:hypothetical protein